ncbi:hypothetical protein GCM10020220_017960 [Nonomuraea rubra]|uniref:hypothetical protein n=1 Tax=Nonomuraea rubra TaxID=46180 RepID=UPI0031EFA134
MHLTDAAAFTSGNHHHEGTEDARGDESRPLPAPVEQPAPADVPASLRTMERGRRADR